MAEKITTMTIVVSVDELNRIHIVGRDGRLIGNGIIKGEIFESSDPDFLRAGMLARGWRAAFERMRNAIQVSECRRRKAHGDPWHTKIQTWQSSLLIRCRYEKRTRRAGVGTRLKGAATWKEAITLMWHQRNNNQRYHSLGRWHKWIHNVSKNQNRKAQARYERLQNGNG